MPFVFERIVTEGLAHLSYLIGDTGSGVAFVIDPRRDVELYVELARAHGLAITRIFETHIHADFVSGARELAARCPSAEICVSGEADASYGFAATRVAGGDRFELGKKTVITARHTPGHTPEHLAYEIADVGDEDDPWAVFTGDSLFVGSAGRPDLLGIEHTEELVSQLYHTLYDYFMNLAPGVLVFPAHGAGSPCGPDISDRLESSIAWEHRTNPYLHHLGEDEFKKAMFSAVPEVPAYYPRMKKVNAEGPAILGAGPHVAAMPSAEFKAAAESGEAILLDVRHMLGFGGGHIPGAINIGLRPLLSIWAGWMLDPDRPILLVLERDDDLARVLPLLTRVGFDRYAGYLAGGMQAWQMAGLPLQRLPQMSVHDVKAALDVDPASLFVLDVRSSAEWDQGHVPHAVHHFAPEFRNGLPEGLPKDRPVATYCGSGYRANIVASILQARGVENVRNVPGSWSAWKAAGYPVEKNGSPEGAD